MVEPDSILSHVSLGVDDTEAAGRFYDAFLAPLGIARIMEAHGAIAWGRAFPEFWVGAPLDGEPASVGNGTHVSFLATSRSQVDAAHAAGLTAGGSDDGAPGLRAYGEGYYAAFLRDPFGHRVEVHTIDGMFD
ncbi:MAG: VOC family protein [Alphaproteobacteria bacterium]|nr:VOC family protein [Alphaproteobacteria bacterium]